MRLGHRLTRGVMTEVNRRLIGAQKTPAWSADWLHFCRFLANPLKVGSVVPASGAVGRLIGALVQRKDHELVVELGAGTGVITRAILAAGIPADRLVAVEVDSHMAKFLRSSLPGVLVIEGDAFDLVRILPPQIRGKVGTVVCGISVAMLPYKRQRELVAAALSVMPVDGQLLVFSYWLTSPLPAARLGLVCKKRAFTLRNLPPASVWVYERAG